MKIAILVYGYFYIDNEVALWRAPQSKVQLNSYSFITDSFDHFMSHIYTPLKLLYQDVDVYMITHEFDHHNFDKLKKQLLEKCNFFNFFFTNRIESPKLPCTYYNLLRFVLSKKIKYDRYIITRNDLFYKSKIINWMPEITKKDFCWYLFKDHPDTWKNNQIISDIIFIIDNDKNGFSNFMKCIYEHIKNLPENNDLHKIYKIIESIFKDNVGCIAEGHYDSNTAKYEKLSCNPIYIMLHRSYNFDENDNLDMDKTHNNFFSFSQPSAIVKKIIAKSYNGGIVTTKKEKNEPKIIEKKFTIKSITELIKNKK